MRGPKRSGDRNGTTAFMWKMQAGTWYRKNVQELLGYSDVSATMNVYAHATREAKRDSAKLLDKVVGMN